MTVRTGSWLRRVVTACFDRLRATRKPLLALVILLIVLAIGYAVHSGTEKPSGAGVSVTGVA